jgi:hypothetical protein
VQCPFEILILDCRRLSTLRPTPAKRFGAQDCARLEVNGVVNIASTLVLGKGNLSSYKLR